MHASRLIRLNLVAAAFSVAFGARAQAPAAPPAAPKEKKAADAGMQKVEVKGSTQAYDPRRDDTASKIVVNHEEIVKYGDTNVLDVLKRLPGVTVSGASGRGGEIRMRGLGSGYTQILINGERAPAGFSMDSLAPDVIERIEVLRAASAEFSTQSIAGTINIVLKKAIKTAQREIKTSLTKARGNVAPGVNLQLSDRDGQLSYSLSVNAFSSRFERESPTREEGSDAAGRRTLLRTSTFHEDGRFDALNIAPRLNWTFDNGDTLTSQTFLNTNHFRRQSEQTITTALGAAPQYPYVDWALDNTNDYGRTDLNWVKKFASGAKLDTKIGASLNRMDNDSKRRGYAGAGGAFLLDNRVTAQTTDRGYTSTGKYATPAVDGHALAIGWDGGVSTRDDARIQREQPLPGAWPVNSDETFASEVTRLAAYAQDEWNVTPRWSVYLGVRWEGIATETSGSTFATATSRSSVWSPLFQTLYKLPDTKGDQLRFAVTRTYKAPGAGSLVPRRFTVANNTSTDPDFQGNPDLKPELALGFDASYEHYWGEGALLSASASLRRIDGYTRNRIQLADDGRWVSLPVNDGNATTRGIELEAKFPLKAVLADAPALDLRASISRNWSSVSSVPGPDNRLDQQTPFSATVGVDYKSGALTTGGSYAFRNGGPVRQSLTQSSYVSVRRDLDLYGLWKFDPSNQLRVALSNVLGQDYVSESSYADAGGTVRRASVYPGDVSLRATMEMKF